VSQARSVRKYGLDEFFGAKLLAKKVLLRNKLCA